MGRSRTRARVTLSDVAAESGVSTITVSRALREPHRVSAPLRERIDAAVEALGYVPNLAAQALASQHTNVIGVLIPSVTNNVFSDLLSAIYDTVSHTRFQIQLANTQYSVSEEEKLVRIFLNQRPAGLVVTGIDQSAACRQLLSEANCPVIQIMETAPDPIDMMVGFSHYDGAARAARHLIEKGYRRIGFIGARMDPRTQRRMEGCLSVLDAFGMLDRDLVSTTEEISSVNLGAAMLGALVDRRPDLDAVFTNNDDLALGALFECQRRAIAVPDALGICGFNDLEMVRASAPSLTSVDTRRGEMGQRAMTMLMDAIEGKRPQKRVVDLSSTVIARQSTARGTRDDPAR
ncbi:HTH-type transcriptional regulator GntR [Pararhizobium mangrovi]|uniref:LacI family DNA-binding transcriptional regulator n=1 Tax=Pararhizobium mangrovi TaxID=2590452 RepID=A0A506UI09_9HYPH|nr:LacI family DNA-binding transcriptional regulator [Pararhizobium mangrovi]TPW32946.1 LacI family DNA-binding transcriptional regulator [Pararhizobium mangrovi]